MQIKDRLNALRRLMKESNIDAYIITSSDFHSSEYVGKYFAAREYMSGFTGSAGTLAVLDDSAYLWTDGRYFLQAEAQLSGSGIELMKQGCKNVKSIPDFLSDKLENGSTIGFDGRTVSNSFVLKLKKSLDGKNINYISQKDLVDKIWTQRPPLSQEPVWELDIKYCGKSTMQKLADVRSQMQCDYLIITALDDIAWLLNLRGNDIPCTPVFLSYMIIGRKNSILAISSKKLNEKITEKLSENNIDIVEYDKFYSLCSMLKGSVQLDSASANYALLQSLSAECEIFDTPSPIEAMKAIKNDIEIQNIKNAHIKDGVALTKFIYRLKNSVKHANITELDAVRMVNTLRSEQEDFVGISFDSIIAYKEHGAIVHYEPDESTNIIMKAEGFCLADTGGHYLDGTTDVTRTIALGHPTQEEKRCYTLVLKGNINLASSVFRHGCTGENLDITACMPLWREGLDFNHSTGHGVGYLLSVHEGPQRIYWDVSKNNHIPLEKGMIISNEPGLYIENKFGIRLENLMLVKDYMQSEYGSFLCLEALTLAPFELSAIDANLLTQEEIKWLNDYHKRVFDEISPYLDEEEKEWLANETKAI